MSTAEIFCSSSVAFPPLAYGIQVTSWACSPSRAGEISNNIVFQSCPWIVEVGLFQHLQRRVPLLFVAEKGYPGNYSRLCIMSPAQDTDINPGWVFSFHPVPPPLSLSFPNQDIPLFTGSLLKSALMTLLTLHSLQTLKCLHRFHMEVSHPLHFS